MISVWQSSPMTPVCTINPWDVRLHLPKTISTGYLITRDLCGQSLPTANSKAALPEVAYIKSPMLSLWSLGGSVDWSYHCWQEIGSSYCLLLGPEQGPSTSFQKVKGYRAYLSLICLINPLFTFPHLLQIPGGWGFLLDHPLQRYSF